MLLCDSSYLGYLHGLYNDQVKLQKINLSVDGLQWPAFLVAINQPPSENIVVLIYTLCKQFKISSMQCNHKNSRGIRGLYKICQIGPIHMLLRGSSWLGYLRRFIHILCLIDCLELEKTSMFMEAVLKSLSCYCFFYPNNLWACCSFLRWCSMSINIDFVYVMLQPLYSMRYLSATLLNARYYRLRPNLEEMALICSGEMHSIVWFVNLFGYDLRMPFQRASCVG